MIKNKNITRKKSGFSQIILLIVAVGIVLAIGGAVWYYQKSVKQNVPVQKTQESGAPQSSEQGTQAAQQQPPPQQIKEGGETTAKNDFGCFPASCLVIPKPSGRKLCEDWKSGKAVEWPSDCSIFPSEGCKKLCNAERSGVSLPPQQKFLEPLSQKEFQPQFVYSEEKLLFTGGYADPSVIKMPDGAYFMYLNKFNQQSSGYFVLSSEDALTWKIKTDIIFPGSATGRAFLTDKGVRFYYPTAIPLTPSEPPSNLISSFAEDGANFSKDSSIRIQPRQGFYISGPTVIRLKDGAYRMFFAESDIQSIQPGNIEKAEIYGASSSDGIGWKRDTNPTIIAEDTIETGGVKQVLHPFIIGWKNGYLMFYHSHMRVFAAYSDDGLKWQKLGNTGLSGADVNAIALPDGSFRVYFDRFSQATSGEVYTAILKINGF